MTYSLFGDEPAQATQAGASAGDAVVLYKSDRCTIYRGDCLGVLPTLAPADLLVTDPPYGIDYRGSAGNFEPIAGDSSTEAAEQALDALRLGRGRHAYVFWSPAVQQLKADAAKFSEWQQLIWDKQITGMGGGHCWATSHELILFCVEKEGRKARTCAGAARLRRGSVLSCQRMHGAKNSRHPTEKPVPLLRELIESSSKPGEVVLDPFAGVGSTLVAAILEGRRAIGIELDPGYASIAVERVMRAEAIADQMEGL